MANSVLNLSLPLESCGIDMRDAFFDQVNTLAASDRNVLMLSDDQGAFSLDWLQQNLPEQYFNVGIAEQNLVSVAAGLALGGKIPYIYGIATFMTMRCYDQIRGDLCCMQLPVTIVGSGAGYTYSGDGPTHHAAQDVAIMRALPGMTIYNPSDATSTASFARMSYQDPGPKYVRLEKGQWGKIYQEGHDFSTGLDVLVGGKDLMIISTGVMTHRALEVAEELATHRVDAGVIDLYRLKPVNPEILLQAIGGASRIVTLEEHSLIGGVGSAVAEIMADKGHLVPIMRLGLADHFSYNYGSREWLQSMEGLDVPRITEEILATL